MREKILKSLNTSDLSSEEWEDHAHVVAALGAAQSTPEPNADASRRQELLSGINITHSRKHLSIGALLLHIRAGHYKFMPRVIELTAAYVASRARRDRWAGITDERARVVAVEALHRYFHPLCMVCNGVGRIGEPGQVIVLCSRKDGGCGGTGKKAENWRGWMEKVKDVLAVLGAWEGYASGGTRKQSGRQSTKYCA